MRCLSIVCMLAATGCTSKDQSTPSATQAEPQAAQQAKPVLTVYSGRSALLVEPLLKKFAEKRGVELRLRFDKSTEKLANRLAMEGDKSPADVFFAQAVGYLSLLGEKGLMQALPRKLTEKVPNAYRSASDYWVGTSGRLRVMVYSPERVKNVPKTVRK